MKKKYRKLCSEDNTIPLFSQPWWLDAVCGENNWGVVLVEKGGVIQASMPYYRPKPRLIVMPPLTQTMGPWYRTSGNIKNEDISRQKKLAIDLIDGLPDFDYFHQRFHYTITNWQPFFWRGFKQTTRYTYLIPDLSDLESVFLNFSRAKRKNLKRAKNMVSVHHDLDKDEFYDNHRYTLQKQGKKIGYSRELFHRIYEATYNRGSGKTIYALDNEGRLHSALFVIWDSMSAYDLISTIDPEFRSSGSATLLVAEIIKDVSNETKIFDFEGSMIESIANSFSQFGTKAIPYSSIWKGNRPLLLSGINKIKRKLTYLLAR